MSAHYVMVKPPLHDVVVKPFKALGECESEVIIDVLDSADHCDPANCSSTAIWFPVSVARATAMRMLELCDQIEADQMTDRTIEANTETA